MKSKKKTAYRIVSALLILIGVIYYLTLAFAIRNTLMGFKQAVASGDVSGVLQHIDLESVPKILLPLASVGLMPDAKTKVKKYLTYLVEYYFDVDLEENELSDFLRSLEVRKAFLWPGWRRCSVSAELRYSSQNTVNKKKIRVRLARKEREWFISGFTIK